MESETKNRTAEIMWKQGIIVGLWLLLPTVFGIMIWAAETPAPNPATVQNDPSETSRQLNKALIDTVCEKILAGEYSAAETMLDTAIIPPSSSCESLKAIVTHLRTIDEQLQKEVTDARSKAEADLKPFRDNPPANDKDRDKAFSILLRLRNLLGDHQQAEFLRDPFVKKLMQDAQNSADALRSQGRWADAYSHGLFWLRILDKDNLQYEKQADDLIARASLALALKDGPCDTAADRFQGVQKDMLLKAITTLDFRYVELVDYDGMVRAVLDEAERIPDVLEKSADPVSISFRKEGLPGFREGIGQFRAMLDERPRPYPKEIFLHIVEDTLALNTETIRLSEPILVALLSETAMSALDPYTTLVWPADVNQFQKAITQEFDGIGVRLSKQGKFLKIGGIIPDTPAARAGVEAGELIVAVDGQSTEAMSSNCAVEKIAGPRGTTVTLTIQKPGATESRNVILTRARIVVPSISTDRRRDGESPGAPKHLIDPENRLGYIRLSNFVENTTADLERTLTQLEAQELRGLILDLRGNPGGLLQAAIEVVDLFIEEGPILQSKPRFLFPSFWTARREGTHPPYPLVVIIDGASASASEIVAGALQDPKHQRATLVGTRSFGKGTVQEITNATGAGSQFKYTTAQYHLPSGQPVVSRYMAERRHTQDWGIVPDIEVKASRPNRRMSETNQQGESSDLDNSEDNEEFQAAAVPSKEEDPQLAVGLLILQTKLVQSGQLIQLARAEDPKARDNK